ncbi:MAG: oxidoreductase [Bryobacteraceae bacterium]
MSGKAKVAFYWCASCGGCEEAVVDLAEKILDVTAAVDIVLWPVALDFKRRDIEAMADGSITVTFLNGAIRSSEQEEMVHLLRKKSQVMIAFGSCSQLGGIPGLANLWDRQTIFQAVYKDSPSTVNAEGTTPQTSFQEDGRTATLPVFADTVRTLDQVVDVDYYIPGCAPTSKMLMDAVEALLAGKLPPKGSVLAPDKALCDECQRRDSKPEKLAIAEFKRPHEILADPEKCLLAQGLLCLGPATRGGCGALCPAGNMPCTGCYGPTSRVRDYGAKALTSLASIVDASDDETIQKVLAGIPDPIGTLYRYSLPASLLKRKVMEAKSNVD